MCTSHRVYKHLYPLFVEYSIIRVGKLLLFYFEGGNVFESKRNDSKSRTEA